MLITHKIADSFTPLSPHKFATDASDLGLRPGQWPSQIRAEIGNGMPFLRGATNRDGRAGEISSIKYSQANGCIDLIIFND